MIIKLAACIVDAGPCLLSQLQQPVQNLHKWNCTINNGTVPFESLGHQPKIFYLDKGKKREKAGRKKDLP